ncbi:hypothetical protein GCM10012275_29890 [Longimycelium tulufanense]|uniref:IacB n=1 Tax=Longimycelium tulufanense TaxID=907463 RepID=A0A8J3C8M8_9PSEU|nr:hypothetical protein [Longimycelium tulufanense]GGM56778.1 hypothetical protein GCM10012275_29890 [Longimycelium tulufanense]
MSVPTTTPLRVLFCLGATQAFFDAPDEESAAVAEALEHAFANLTNRFGVTVLGTLDDDRVSVGANTSWPWTSYVLVDAPDMDTVVAICDLVRETRVGQHRLWRYVRIEARIGRPLFFGNR